MAKALSSRSTPSRTSHEPSNINTPNARIQRTLKTINPAPPRPRSTRARSRDRHTRARHGRPRVEHRIDPARGARRDAANRDQARRRAQGATATRRDATTARDRDGRRFEDDRPRRRATCERTTATTRDDADRSRARDDVRTVARRRDVAIAVGRTRASRHDRSIDRRRTTGRIFARGIRDRSWIIVWGNSEG